MTESSGALAKPVVMLLRALARLATLPSGNNTTVYGSSRASPKSFFPHHVTAISAAIAPPALLLPVARAYKVSKG